MPDDVPPVSPVMQKLEALRAELADLAFHLEKRGRLDAADLATATAARLGEFCNELTTGTRGGAATASASDGAVVS